MSAGACQALPSPLQMRMCLTVWPKARSIIGRVSGSVAPGTMQVFFIY